MTVTFTAEDGLADVLNRLRSEFSGCPVPDLETVFDACVSCLDTCHRDSRPELVYRLASQRLRDVAGGRFRVRV